jgi:anaerobic selenocysteine-containing dehydrogenase
LNGWQANDSADRLTKPLVRRGDKLEEATWDEAMQLIVDKSKQLLDEFGPGSMGFYNSGQLFIEDYFTLSTIAKAGIGTNHLDGNTRLCTATAAAALVESFGSDGQPGSYRDIDFTDCILHAGHNTSNTQTVLWSRILDRRRSKNPPKLIVIDPRKTETAAEADIHLAPRAGTNVALMNGLINLIIENGDIDKEFIEKRTQGFRRLKETTSKYPPEKVEEITGVPAAQLREAAQILGSAKRLFSTVLQGFYQSNQATAAAVQVNNVNLIRGMIGKPGCGVLQMNGQPTAQNTRETGCNGQFPLFANFNNDSHLERLAAGWNIDLFKMPTWYLPTHVMEMIKEAADGTIKFLWVIGTNPAVSLPELHRIRKVLGQKQLFLVVQDAFLTETAELADVVLPAAIWAEKTGTFTNADRTVHLSLKAIDPLGEAKADMDIFIDYAKRMGFKDKDGKPLIKWTDSESCFDAWCKFSKGWFCDYSGFRRRKLREQSVMRNLCMTATCLKKVASGKLRFASRMLSITRRPR